MNQTLIKPKVKTDKNQHKNDINIYKAQQLLNPKDEKHPAK